MSLDKLTLTTCFWFDGQAEEAAGFYVSVFKNSKITHIQRYSDAGKESHGHEAGSVLVAEFQLNGHRFIGLNGGPSFKFTPAISFLDKFGEGGPVDSRQCGPVDSRQCGWLTDKYGVSWQIVPTALKEMLSSPDKEKADRATVAMMHMKKLEIVGLRKAFEGEDGCHLGLLNSHWLPLWFEELQKPLPDC
ncbi:putative 3-demethylubiquinone-9 3-methyltransferase [Lasiosphaeria miniovina]|uniref:3-demethylubiquinone-9 3-methyltransferase n=1 Tax=Lasiosphaeria miniovina TaxID=1954250 RepID=A0AA40BIB8_9PEZI|nr:putative 3-demethylubiquinone-9 3-methyltransferase [Lasiosphaeria miniovina]KAK0734754.1 putative 3-demethylubiquinone-9 3-methyltransferase [Lasiosphaeria miniovina]